MNTGAAYLNEWLRVECEDLLLLNYSKLCDMINKSAVESASMWRAQSPVLSQSLCFKYNSVIQDFDKFTCQVSGGLNDFSVT